MFSAQCTRPHHTSSGIIWATPNTGDASSRPSWKVCSTRRNLQHVFPLRWVACWTARGWHVHGTPLAQVFKHRWFVVIFQARFDAATILPQRKIHRISQTKNHPQEKSISILAGAFWLDKGAGFGGPLARSCYTCRSCNSHMASFHKQSAGANRCSLVALGCCTRVACYKIEDPWGISSFHIFIHS